mgnify:FL=1
MNDGRGPADMGQTELHYTPARRSSRRSSGGWLKGVVALAVVGIAVAGFFLWPVNMAKAIEKGMAAQKAAESMLAQGKMTMTMDIGMGEQKMDMPMNIVVAKPNKVAMSMGDGKGPFSVRMVCDGTNLYMDIPMLGKVIQAPAPKTLEEMSKSQFSSGMMGMGAGGGSGLMPGQMTKEDIASIKSGLPKGSDWYKTLERPDGTRAATITTKDGTTLAAWLDPSTGLVYQVAMDMNGDTMKKAAAKSEPKGAKALGDLNMKMRILVKFDKLELNGKTTADQFKFSTSGKQVKKVKSLDDLKNPAVLLGR